MRMSYGPIVLSQDNLAGEHCGDEPFVQNRGGWGYCQCYVFDAGMVCEREPAACMYLSEDGRLNAKRAVVGSGAGRGTA